MHYVVYALLAVGAFLVRPAALQAQEPDSTVVRANLSIPVVPARDIVAALGIPYPDSIVVTVAKPEPPKARKRPDRWKISAAFSYTDQSGNKVLRLLTSGLNVSHLDKDRYKLDAMLQSRYGQSDGEVVARNQYGSISINLHPKGMFSPFLYANAERDVFQRLNLRFSGGAGAVFTPFPNRDGEASLSLALVDSYEDLRATQSDPKSPTRNLARFNVQLKGSNKVSEGVSIHHTSNFQPAANELADYLLRTDTGMKVVLTEKLALSVDYQLNRNAQPPEGVEPNDRLLKTGFIIDF
ncbi:MAG TPA: DUF481 domain-containing protein [Longimicrobiaceae bacterium]|nr:DUF481 domain-containing protein [Longimicrobiaceae bacterium]